MLAIIVAFTLVLKLYKEEISRNTSGNLSISASKLESLTAQCSKWFINKSDESKGLIIAEHRDIYKNDSKISLQEQVIDEVFNYLQIKSSYKLLEALVHFSIYEAWIKLIIKKPNLEDLFCYGGLSVRKVKFELVGIIVRTPWLEALSQINSSNEWEQRSKLFDYFILGKKPDTTGIKRIEINGTKVRIHKVKITTDCTYCGENLRQSRLKEHIIKNHKK